jgi:DNA repair protein REV1
MDSFFASVVLRNFPEYRDKPVAISHMGKQVQQGTGVNPPQRSMRDSTSECATCNYEARKYGIKKGMFLGRARELCPELIILHYDFEGYEDVSEQVAEILHRLAEVYDGTVEQVSCDEAYVEFFLSSDDCDGKQEEMVWKIAEDIRKEIFETTQCTATVGVASNKLLAKLAADQAKPNKSMVVKDYRVLLEPLKLRDLHGIGYSMERKLTAESLVSVRDVWELGDHAESELIRILGPGLGRKIWLFCKGIDDRPVKAVERKTIGAEVSPFSGFENCHGLFDLQVLRSCL